MGRGGVRGPVGRRRRCRAQAGEAAHRGPPGGPQGLPPNLIGAPTPIPPGPAGVGVGSDPAPIGPPTGGLYDSTPPRMPPYAWPTYAPYNNFSRVGYPTEYPASAF